MAYSDHRTKAVRPFLKRYFKFQVFEQLWCHRK